MALAEIVLLPDISEEAPAGENLELDSDFVAMERAAEGTPETQYGETINAAVPADWKEVEALGSTLLERTRDIRVMVMLAVARLNLAGPEGFAAMLAQIRNQIETHWDHVHPQLDPEDDNDPTLRANSLVRLQDPRNVMRPLRDMALARTPQTGPVTWRDIAVAAGQMDPEPGRDKMTEAFIRGAFSATDRERLTTLRENLERAARETKGIATSFDAVAGPMLDLTNLEKQLDTLLKDLRRYEPAADAPAEAMAAADDTSEAPTGPGERVVYAPRGVMSARSLTSLNGREDALYLLDLVSGWFRSNEPSSPVPLLIDRAKRLASMEFIDILRDLAPDGLGQAQIVTGTPPE